MKLKHIHWHKFHHSSGANDYYECRCGHRKYKSRNFGYSPIDFEWLAEKDNVSLEELKKIKLQLWDKCFKSGIMKKCYSVLFYLGDGEKFEHKVDNNTIMFSEKEHRFQIRYNGKEVVNSKECLFIPGKWMLIIDDLYLLSEEKRIEKNEKKIISEKEANEISKRQLVEELTIN